VDGGGLEDLVKNNLPELRARRNWSQGDLAAALGVSRQTVNAIEKERYDPSLPLALKIGRLFETPVERIFLEGESS
jgi:putative transcriptional regulator